MGRRAIARLSIDETDGTKTVGGGGSLPLDEIAILDRLASGGQLWLRDDPLRWAARCHQIFRSGYVIARRVDDSAR